MKRLLILFAVLLSLAFSVSASPSIDGGTSKPEQNYLVLQGELITDQKVTIQIFQHDVTDCSWIRVEQQSKKKRYELLLSPTESYQIWFQSPDGYTRIVYIDAGDPGLWKKIYDISFEQKALEFIHMYQTCSKQDLGIYYLEEIDSQEQAESELPATNCTACN